MTTTSDIDDAFLATHARIDLLDTRIDEGFREQSRVMEDFRGLLDGFASRARRIEVWMVQEGLSEREEELKELRGEVKRLRDELLGFKGLREEVGELRDWVFKGVVQDVERVGDVSKEVASEVERLDGRVGGLERGLGGLVEVVEALSRDIDGKGGGKDQDKSREVVDDQATELEVEAEAATEASFQNSLALYTADTNEQQSDELEDDVESRLLENNTPSASDVESDDEDPSGPESWQTAPETAGTPPNKPIVSDGSDNAAIDAAAAAAAAAADREVVGRSGVAALWRFLDLYDESIMDLGRYEDDD